MRVKVGDDFLLFNMRCKIFLVKLKLWWLGLFKVVKYFTYEVVELDNDPVS